LKHRSSFFRTNLQHFIFETHQILRTAWFVLVRQKQKKIILVSWISRQSFIFLSFFSNWFQSRYQVIVSHLNEEDHKLLLLIYEAWVLHFMESTGTGYQYAYDTLWVRTDGVLIFFIFHFATDTRLILLWYAHGTPVVYESKKMQFFLFLLFIFFVYRKIYVFYLFNIKVTTLLISNNQVVVGFIHLFIGKK
jgi:hypothetical protein